MMIIVGFSSVFTIVWLFVLLGILHFREETCDQHTACFCEPPLNKTESVLAQPVSSLSNITYIILGLLSFYLHHPRDVILSSMFNLLLIFLGIASLYLHALLTKFSSGLDIFSIILFLSFMVVLPIWEYFRQKLLCIIIFTIILVTFSLIQFLVPDNPSLLLGNDTIIQVVLTSLFFLFETLLILFNEDYRHRIKYKWYIVSFIFMLIAIIVWALSMQTVCPDAIPGSLHANWHIFSAFGIFFYGLGRFNDHKNEYSTIKPDISV